MLKPRRIRLFRPTLPVALALLTLCVAGLARSSLFAAEGGAAPTVVRVAVLNASGDPASGDRVALVLGEHVRRGLEDQMGMRLELVNVSRSPEQSLAQSEINYKPGFLHAALMIAKFLPGDQRVRVMLPDNGQKLGIDIEILVGKD